jgi:hypothetical protein
MNYEDVKQANEWISMMNEYYLENIGGVPVFVFKLDKKATKIDPLYGEEIDGRIYLRPFKIEALHLVNPFEFMFRDNLIGEFESEVKNFNFNLNQMVQKMKALKEEPLSMLYISSDGNHEIEKNNKQIVLYEDGLIAEKLDLNIFQTVEEVGTKLAEHLTVEISENDDYSRNIPNFNKTNFSGSTMLLKTFNREYRNCSDVIEKGDLIYTEDNNVLYEVTSSQVAGNFGWKYHMWNVKCDKSYPYVEYNKLKSKIYGFNNIDFGYRR